MATKARPCDPAENLKRQHLSLAASRVLCGGRLSGEHVRDFLPHAQEERLATVTVELSCRAFGWAKRATRGQVPTYHEEGPGHEQWP